MAILSSTYVFFKVLRTHVLFGGPLVPLLWISGDVSSGFQSQSGFCLIHFFVEVNVMYIPQDPPLVLHVPTSWQPAAQAVFLSKLVLFPVQLWLHLPVGHLQAFPAKLPSHHNSLQPIGKYEVQVISLSLAIYFSIQHTAVLCAWCPLLSCLFRYDPIEIWYEFHVVVFCFLSDNDKEENLRSTEAPFVQRGRGTNTDQTHLWASHWTTGEYQPLTS